MSPVPAERSLLLVHAHPDDESIFTGATMAKYAAEGARVTLVTCTMGEEGRNSRTRSVEAADGRLGELRARELETACAALGVTDHRFLGGRGRWRDSGPHNVPGRIHPGSFCAADLDKAASELTAVIREVRPQVVVTYDANGSYGHPDHIQANRVAWRAYQLGCDPLLTKFYAIVMPRSVLAGSIKPPAGSIKRPVQGADAATRPAHPPGGNRPRPVDPLHYGTPDEQVTTEIDASAYLAVKIAALRAHATQITVDGQFFQAAGLVPLRLLGTEYYALLAGSSGAVVDADDQVREDDLFAGV